MKRTALKRKTPLKRGKRLAPVSGIQKIRLKAYKVRRDAYLLSHPRCTALCMFPATDVHHKQGRVGARLLDEQHWMAVCRRCHDWIHANPQEATKQGWMIAR